MFLSDAAHIDLHTTSQLLSEEKPLFQEGGSLAPLPYSHFKELADKAEVEPLEGGWYFQLGFSADYKPALEIDVDRNRKAYCLWPALETKARQHSSGRRRFNVVSKRVGSMADLEDWTRTEQDSITGTWLKHKDLIRRLALGQDLNVIAEDTGYSKHFIRDFSKSPVAKDKIMEVQQHQDDIVREAHERIMRLSQDAVGVLESIVTGEEEGATVSQKFKAAESILSRAGIPAVSRNEGTVDHKHYLDRDSIEELKRRAISAGVSSGQIVDCEEGNGGYRALT